MAWVSWLGLLLVASAFGADDLGALQDRAVAANPGLAAQQARTREMEDRARVAGAWMDPMVSVEYSNVPVNSLALGDHPMSGIQFVVRQEIHPLGWSGRKRLVGEQAADAASWEAAEAEQALRMAVANAYWGIARARMLRAITEQHVARTEEIRGAVTARYEVGTAGQSAVLRLGVLLDRLNDDLRELDRQERELAAMLGQALGADGPAEVDTPEHPDPIAPIGAAAAWIAQATETRPALRAADARIASEQAGVRAAKSDALPDPQVWAGYRLRAEGMDPGTDLVSAGIAVPIPAGSARRAHGERDARLEGAARATAERDALVDRIAADAAAIEARWTRASDKAATYGTALLPGAEAVLTATQVDFSVDRADFAALFEAEVAVLDLERALAVAIAETHLQHAAATALIGAPPTGATR